jgi:hypothetical protein
VVLQYARLPLSLSFLLGHKDSDRYGAYYEEKLFKYRSWKSTEQTKKQTDIETDRQTDRQTDGQTTDRQVGRQTDRQTVRQKEIIIKKQ